MERLNVLMVLHLNEHIKKCRASLRLILKKFPDLTPEKLKAKLDAVADDGARQMTQSIFREIEQTTEEVGNTVDATGRPLTKELFLEMIEKIEIDFTADGQWIPPSIVMHPDVWKANEAKFKEWEQDKEFTTRHEVSLPALSGHD